MAGRTSNPSYDGLVRDGNELRREVDARGFALSAGVWTAAEVAELRAALEKNADSEGNPSSRQRGGVYAIRNLIDSVEEVAELATSKKMQAIVEPILGRAWHPVRGILFDKIASANWKVPWHQDVTIAVAERVDIDGFGPWSVKSGVLHVQPPRWVLEGMLSVRLHLDDCREDNGPLRVVPHTHTMGRIPEEEIPMLPSRFGEHLCAADAGDALLMRPLLLHASSASRQAGHRRVIHLDFAGVPLPGGLRWAAATRKALRSC